MSSKFIISFLLSVLTLGAWAENVSGTHRALFACRALSRPTTYNKAGQSNNAFVSWRRRSYDDTNTSYELYHNGTLYGTYTSVTNVTTKGINVAEGTHLFTLVVKQNGVETERDADVPMRAAHYINIKLDMPDDGRGLKGAVEDAYTTKDAVWTPDDCSAYDMDGDGEQEIILKWKPDNAMDNTGNLITSNTFLDCYKLDGTRLWRIDLGQNIRSGSHYTQFLCYDYDGDGKGELIVKTAPGTIDGEGNYIMNGLNKNKNYYNAKGKIFSGEEWLTCFDGTTGAELKTVDYYPCYAKHAADNWGDGAGKTGYNRGTRFKAAVAVLPVDGSAKPCAVMMRGYYTYSYSTAYTWDGKDLSIVWKHESTKGKDEGTYGQGAHSVAVGDVDNDGYDEIVVGSACIDHDGSTLWRTGLGHGDALHLGEFDPDNEGMEVYFCTESPTVPYDAVIVSAKDGKVLYGSPQSGYDTGRCIALDMDPTVRGAELIDYTNLPIYNAYGGIVCEDWKAVSASGHGNNLNFRIYWDGDLCDEMLDRTYIDKWNPEGKNTTRIYVPRTHGLKADRAIGKNGPNLVADLLGDWREEYVNYALVDGVYYLVLHTTNVPSDYALPWLRDDHVYDMAIAWQNVAYNQPPHLSYSPMDYFSMQPAYKADKTTAIEQVSASDNRNPAALDTEVIYNIYGQRVTTTIPGCLYITNGRKFIAK